MARKIRIGPVREFLEKAKMQTYDKMKLAISDMHFTNAEIYNRFVEDVLDPALELCGEQKPREVKDERQEVGH